MSNGGFKRWMIAALAALLPALPAGAQAGVLAPLEDLLTGPASLLLTPAEREIVAEIRSPAEARRFEQWFWDRRDPLPETAFNEFRALFQERVAWAEREFGTDSARLPGWQTPQGTVYALLGEPDFVDRYDQQAFADGRMLDLMVWTYTTLRQTWRPVRFFFVRTPDGIRMATEPESREATDQPGWLRLAREWTIANPALTTPTAALRTDDAVLTSFTSAGFARGGVFAEISVPVPSLLGAPLRDGVHYTFDVRLETRAGAQRLGIVQMRISTAEMAAFDGRDLRLALWFPTSAPRPGDRLQIIERPSGRDVTIELIANGELAPEYPIGKELAIAELMQGSGVVVAYLPPTAQSPEPVAWLLTAAAPSADTVALPGNVFALRREVP